jgi:hypothetical protein
MSEIEEYDLSEPVRSATEGWFVAADGQGFTSDPAQALREVRNHAVEGRVEIAYAQ